MKVKRLKQILDKFDDNDDILILNVELGVVKNLVSWTRSDNELILNLTK